MTSSSTPATSTPSTLGEHVSKLIKLSAEANSAPEAHSYAQAAQCCANAMTALTVLEFQRQHTAGNH